MMKIEGFCVYQSPFDEGKRMLCSFGRRKAKSVAWMCGRVKARTMCKWEISAREKGWCSFNMTDVKANVKFYE